MTWFYNSDSGELTSASGVEALLYEGALHTGLGWHELPIPANDNETQAAAAASRLFPNGTPPTTSIGKGLLNAPGGLAGQGLSDVGNATGLSGLSDIGDFFHRLTESNTWVRVGEVIFGGIILWAGVKAVTSQTPVGNAARATTRTARKPARTALRVVAPEARLAGRTAAKKIAPKTTQRVAAHRQQVRQYGGKRAYNP